MEQKNDSVNIINEGRKAKERLDQVKYLLKRGLISYDRAKEEASPFLNTLNLGMKEISKAHGFKHRPVAFASYMR